MRMEKFRTILDRNKIASLLDNPDSRDMPTLIVIRPNGDKIYIIVGKHQFSIGEEVWDVDKASDHTDPDAAMSALRRIYYD
jgi:hypothetical protein